MPTPAHQLVANYMPLVRKLCYRFRMSSEPQEDLFQTGVIGLLWAIEKFDPRHGGSFAALAIPVVMGAILNYLRDHGSLFKAPRSLRQMKQTIDTASERLASHLGRWPTSAELAQECELAEGDVHDALEFARVGEPRSLDETLDLEDSDGCLTLSERVGSEDGRYDRTLELLTLAAAMDTLPARDKTILSLRYSEGLSQKQTGERVAISQMHVSRLERSALLKLKLCIQSRGTSSHSGGPRPLDTDRNNPLKS